MHLELINACAQSYVSTQTCHHTPACLLSWKWPEISDKYILNLLAFLTSLLNMQRLCVLHRLVGMNRKKHLLLLNMNVCLAVKCDETRELYDNIKKKRTYGPSFPLSNGEVGNYKYSKKKFWGQVVEQRVNRRFDHHLCSRLQVISSLKTRTNLVLKAPAHTTTQHSR